MKRVLILEDDENVASCIAGMLPGSERITVHTMHDAKQQMRDVHFDIIIADMILPDSPEPKHTAAMVGLFGKDSVKIGISGLIEADNIPEGFDAVANKLDLLTPGELLTLIKRATDHARSVPALEKKAQ